MSKKTRRPILLLLVMVLLATMLASCTQSEPASEEPEVPAVAQPEQPEATEPPPTEAPEPTAPPVEQKLTIAVNQLGEALDTTIASKETSWRQEFLIYDPIVSMGTDGNPHPGLATSWQALDDTTWEFKLR